MRVAVVVIAMLLASPTAGEVGTSVSRSLIGLFLLGPVVGALVGWIGIVTLVRDTIGLAAIRLGSDPATLTLSAEVILRTVQPRTPHVG